MQVMGIVQALSPKPKLRTVCPTVEQLNGEMIKWLNGNSGS